jgi:hypothetical protein
MTDYFKKLDIDLSDLNLEDINSDVVLHKPRGLDFTYYEIKQEYVSVLTDRLPESYKDKLKIITYVIVGGPNTYYPHRDNVGVCAINYYIKSGPAETSFYEFNTETPKFVVIDGIEYEGWYDYVDLTKLDSFVSESNECYLLNTSAIHDLKLTTEDERHFIQYIFNEQL